MQPPIPSPVVSPEAEAIHYEVDAIRHEVETARRERALRWMEWALVVAVGFLQPFLLSMYSLVVKGTLVPKNYNSGVAAGFTVAQDLLSLAVLGYVLFRQGSSWHKNAQSWGWTDILAAIWLVLLSRSAQMFLMLLFYLLVPSQQHLFKLKPTNIPDFHLTLFPLLMMIVNPFYEELILRAFTQSEITSLTNKGWLAVLASLVIQVSLHFYQGVFIAFSYIPLFATFALYYQYQRRIWPVILCHMYFDVTALITLAQMAKHAS